MIKKNNWRTAWQQGSYRIKCLTGLAVLLATLVYFPFFFEIIQSRSGAVLSDILLDRLAPHNMSLPVFMIIWASTLLLTFRALTDPDLFLLVIWGYNLLTVARLICIAAISLTPPSGLIPLADPLTNLFYGSRYITHDLFFSGHTASVCLIFFCLKGRIDKYFVGIATISIGILLLVQHVHYTIDVLAAPVFAYGAWFCARFFTEKERRLLTNG